MITFAGSLVEFRGPGKLPVELGQRHLEAIFSKARGDLRAGL
jgi:hypothetical protein